MSFFFSFTSKPKKLQIETVHFAGLCSLAFAFYDCLSVAHQLHLISLVECRCSDNWKHVGWLKAEIFYDCGVTATEANSPPLIKRVKLNKSTSRKFEFDWPYEFVLLQVEIMFH